MGHSVARHVRSLALLTPLTHSTALRSLCSLTPFMGLLNHFAHSLVGQLKFLNMCSRYKRVSQEQTRFSSSLETRPESSLFAFLTLAKIFFIQSRKHRFLHKTSKDLKSRLAGAEMQMAFLIIGQEQ